jgi:hypothetical protein
VRYTDGTVLQFVVTGGKSELKPDVQHDAAVWSTSTVPVLVLVTCDKASPVVRGHHLSNWLVFAVPA